jgi:hypothetical protein
LRQRWPLFAVSRWLRKTEEPWQKRWRGLSQRKGRHRQRLGQQVTITRRIAKTLIKST